VCGEPVFPERCVSNPIWQCKETDGGDELNQDADVPITTVHEAIALLGLEASDKTAHQQLKAYEGQLGLPSHFNNLLGRERVWKIEAPTGAKMAEELRKLLLLHTVGHWSRWPVLKSIEIIIPSKRFVSRASDPSRSPAPGPQLFCSALPQNPTSGSFQSNVGRTFTSGMLRALVTNYTTLTASRS
jgi:hypothetical protein